MGVLDAFLSIFASDSNKCVSKSIVPFRFSLDALEFVAGSCSSHGFYDTGDWRPHVSSNTKFYVGEIPKYVGELVRPVAGRI
ncbi:MAG: hypothetical protein K2G21_09380, partial [Muribaculaceae bacterium]|nr:hypothetical protein [Muribaculaceae bacterium]